MTNMALLWLRALMAIDSKIMATTEATTTIYVGSETPMVKEIRPVGGRHSR